MQYVLDLRQRNKFCMSIGGDSRNRAPHNTNKIRISATSQVLTAVLLKIKDLWDVTLCYWARARNVRRTHPTTQRHIPEDINRLCGHQTRKIFRSQLVGFLVLFVCFSILCSLCFCIVSPFVYSCLFPIFFFKFTDHCHRVEPQSQ